MANTNSLLGTAAADIKQELTRDGEISDMTETQQGRVIISEQYNENAADILDTAAGASGLVGLMNATSQMNQNEAFLAGGKAALDAYDNKTKETAKGVGGKG
jgi:hypothetical protein